MSALTQTPKPTLLTSGHERLSSLERCYEGSALGMAIASISCGMVVSIGMNIRRFDDGLTIDQLPIAHLLRFCTPYIELLFFATVIPSMFLQIFAAFRLKKSIKRFFAYLWWEYLLHGVTALLSMWLGGIAVMIMMSANLYTLPILACFLIPTFVLIAAIKMVMTGELIELLDGTIDQQNHETTSSPITTVAHANWADAHTTFHDLFDGDITPAKPKRAKRKKAAAPAQPEAKAS